MAINDKDLVLYLPLNDISDDNIVHDDSDLANHGAVKGNVTLVPDDIFGGCLSFNTPNLAGDHIAASIKGFGPGNQAHTIEIWIYANVFPQERSWPLLLGQVGKGSHHLLLHADGSTNLGMWLGTGFGPKIDKDKWNHIAMVHNGKQLSCYINGKLEGTPRDATFNFTNANLVVAKTQPGGLRNESDFSGRMANLRIYRRALSQAEIQRDINVDKMSLAAFRKSHPIDFRAYDDDQQPVLYISNDTEDRNLNLELRNSSAQAIQFTNGQGAVASETNHHFALRFRPGTLSDSALKSLIDPVKRATILKEADQWDLYFQSGQPAANEAASLYLLYKGASKSFQPDERRSLTLQRMSAAPGGGARGAQVELIPRQLTAGGDSTPITGSRSQYVHITNHQGKKNIPLHVGFVDGNAVLNNGQAQQKPLRLRITNASNDGAIILNPTSDSKPSRFIISFDAEAQANTKEWALVSSANSKDVKVSVGGRDFRPEGIEGDTPEWPITFDSAFSLAAGGHIEVTIVGILTSLPSGHANLYVRYENIPGYWDGQFVCVVEKGPIISDKGNVGIGTAPTPDTKVAIAGALVADNLCVARANDRRGGLFLATAANFNHAIYNNFSNIDGEGSFDGAKWNTGDGLRLRVNHGAQKKLALGINVSGNVGIGKDGGSERLEVDGTVKATKFDGEGAFVKGMIVMWSGASDKVPTGWALCDGNNGTPNLTNKFIVAAGGKYKQGVTGGAETVRLTVKQMPQHSHPNSSVSEAGEHAHGIPSTDHGWAWRNYVQIGDANNSPGTTLTGMAGKHSHPLTITPEGEGAAFETLPPYYAMAFIIKL